MLVVGARDAQKTIKNKFDNTLRIDKLHSINPSLQVAPKMYLITSELQETLCNSDKKSKTKLHQEVENIES